MANKVGDRKETGKKPGRGQHPNSRKNLEKGMARPGDVLNPNGKPPGTPDRATLFKRWLDTPADIQNPESKEAVRATVMDRLALALIKKGIGGDVAAVREVLDGVFGKLADKTQHSFDFSNLTDEELLRLAELRAKLTP